MCVTPVTIRSIPGWGAFDLPSQGFGLSKESDKKEPPFFQYYECRQHDQQPRLNQLAVGVGSEYFIKVGGEPPEGNSGVSTDAAMMAGESSFFVLTYKTGCCNVLRYWVGVIEVAFLKAV